jgi:hypothetical protein
VNPSQNFAWRESFPILARSGPAGFDCGANPKALNNCKDILIKMRSKEEQVIEPFFDSSKYWHFDELHKKVGITMQEVAESD